MKGRGLVAGWVATILLVVVALGWTIVQATALSRSVASADAERNELTRQLEAKRQRMQAELAAKIDLVKDTRWSSEKSFGADILRRLADLARDGHAKVSAVAPVDKEPGARIRESSHRVEMSASFHELVDFATRIERDGGLLEDVVLETPQTKPGEGATNDGLSAQFRLTTIEPSEDAKRIMRRVLSASPNSPKFTLTSALSLPLEGSQERTSRVRDPFKFAEPPVRRRAPGVVTAAAPAPAAVVPMTVKGIVKFPGGVVAIVNDQIVKVGDVVDGHRVESIADKRVELHEPGGGSRSVPLAGFAAVPPAPLMRR